MLAFSSPRRGSRIPRLEMRTSGRRSERLQKTIRLILPPPLRPLFLFLPFSPYAASPRAFRERAQALFFSPLSLSSRYRYLAGRTPPATLNTGLLKRRPTARTGTLRRAIHERNTHLVTHPATARARARIAGISRRYSGGFRFSSLFRSGEPRASWKRDCSGVDAPGDPRGD